MRAAGRRPRRGRVLELILGLRACLCQSTPHWGGWSCGSSPRVPSLRSAPLLKPARLGAFLIYIGSSPLSLSLSPPLRASNCYSLCAAGRGPPPPPTPLPASQSGTGPRPSVPPSAPGSPSSARAEMTSSSQSPDYARSPGQWENGGGRGAMRPELSKWFPEGRGGGDTGESLGALRRQPAVVTCSR